MRTETSEGREEEGGSGRGGHASCRTGLEPEEASHFHKQLTLDGLIRMNGGAEDQPEPSLPVSVTDYFVVILWNPAGWKRSTKRPIKDGVSMKNVREQQGNGGRTGQTGFYNTIQVNKEVTRGLAAPQFTCCPEMASCLPPSEVCLGVVASDP